MNLLGNFLAQYGYENPEEVAIIFEDEVWTFGKLLELSAKLANVLVGLGIKPGDRVAVQTNKRPELLAMNIAVVRTGAAYVPLNDSYTATELISLMNDAEPALIVRNEIFSDDFKTIPFLHLLDLASEQPKVFTDIDCDADAPASILFTSGTTGRAKGAVLSHQNLVDNSRGLISTWELNSADTLIHILPLFHIHGLFVAAYSAIGAGVKMRMFEKFDPKKTVAAMKSGTVLMGVPTHYVRILHETSISATEVKAMRLFISGSAPMLLTTHHEFTERTGQVILERYGMTEAGIITSNPLHGVRKVGTVGKAMPYTQIRLSGSAPSEVEVTGSTVFKNYWRRPELNETEFTADGWFKTGDIGVIDDDGYLEIVGRAKDLVISGGLNIYPKEIESAIEELEGIEECSVIGLPDPDFGEAVTAVVILKPGYDRDASQLRESLLGQIANFKIPKKFYFVDSLPRNVMGKIEKSKLREEISKL